MDNPEMPGNLAVKNIELAVGHAPLESQKEFLLI